VCESRYKPYPYSRARPGPAPARAGRIRLGSYLSCVFCCRYGMRCNFKPLMPISYLGVQLGLIPITCSHMAMCGGLPLLRILCGLRRLSRLWRYLAAAVLQAVLGHVTLSGMCGRPRCISSDLGQSSGALLRRSCMQVLTTARALIRPPAVVRHAAAPRLRWSVA
jgi:hypothetical protein